jgi:hypothetical protein
MKCANISSLSPFYQFSGALLSSDALLQGNALVGLEGGGAVQHDCRDRSGCTRHLHGELSSTSNNNSLVTPTVLAPSKLLTIFIRPDLRPCRQMICSLQEISISWYEGIMFGIVLTLFGVGMIW